MSLKFDVVRDQVYDGALDVFLRPTLQIKILQMNDIHKAFKEFTPKGFRPQKIKYYNVLYENDIINVICFSYYKHTSNLRFILSYYAHGKKFHIDYQDYNTVEFYKTILKIIKENSEYAEELE